VPFIAVLLLAIEISQVLDKSIGHFFFPENNYHNGISLYVQGEYKLSEYFAKPYFHKY
jgi:hypothetical protein